MKKVKLAALICSIIINQVCEAEQIVQPDADVLRNPALQISADSLGFDASAASDSDREELRCVKLKNGFCESCGGGYKAKLPKDASITAAGQAWFSLRTSDARTSGYDYFTWLALTQDEVEQMLAANKVHDAALPGFALADVPAENAPFTTAEFDAAVSGLRLLERSGLSMNRLRYSLFEAETYRRIAAETTKTELNELAELRDVKQADGTSLPPQLTEALSAIRASDEFSISVQRFGSHNFVLLRTNVAAPDDMTESAEATEKNIDYNDELQKKMAKAKEYILTLALTSQADKLFLFCMYAPDYSDESAKLQEQYSVFRLKEMKKEYAAELAYAKKQRDAEMQRMLSSLRVK